MQGIQLKNKYKLIRVGAGNGFYLKSEDVKESNLKDFDQFTIILVPDLKQETTQGAEIHAAEPNAAIPQAD